MDALTVTIIGLGNAGIACLVSIIIGRVVEAGLSARINREVGRIDGKICALEENARSACGLCSADVRRELKDMSAALTRVDERSQILARQTDDLSRKVDRLIESRARAVREGGH